MALSFAALTLPKFDDAMVGMGVGIVVAVLIWVGVGGWRVGAVVGVGARVGNGLGVGLEVDVMTVGVNVSVGGGVATAVGTLVTTGGIVTTIAVAGCKDATGVKGCNVEVIEGVMMGNDVCGGLGRVEGIAQALKHSNNPIAAIFPSKTRLHLTLNNRHLQIGGQPPKIIPPQPLARLSQAPVRGCGCDEHSNWSLIAHRV